MRTKFTLVEMLVVIAIISILASLMLPSLHSAYNSARAVVCANNMRSMGQGVQIYASNYNAFILHHIGLNMWSWSNWEGTIKESLAVGWEIYRCPSDDVALVASKVKWSNWYKRSYGYHAGSNVLTRGGAGIHVDGSSHGWPPTLGRIGGAKLNWIKGPSHLIHFAERWSDYGVLNYGASGVDGVDLVTKFHDLRRGHLFFDGHVEMSPSILTNEAGINRWKDIDRQ